MIVFMHIQKTGGTSFNLLVERHFKKQFLKIRPIENRRGRRKKNNWEKDWRKFLNKRFWYKYRSSSRPPQIVSAHCPYMFHVNDSVLGNENCDYITFLRNPINRWKSQFFHAISNKQSDVYKIWQNKCNKNLCCFLDFCLEYDIACDIMTRQISGKEDIRRVGIISKNASSKKDFGYYSHFGWSKTYPLYSQKEKNDLLKHAKHNLHHIKFLGFQNNFNQDAVKILTMCNLDQGLDLGVFHKRARNKRDINFEEQDVVKLKLINKYDIDQFTTPIVLISRKDNEFTFVICLIKRI